MGEHFDVLIVGAGISGLAAAYHLQQQCPGLSFVVLEGQESFGGTWRTHRYPGVRSDSDLYTFSYRFKPWKGGPYSPASEILTYLGEVIEENELARHIRYRHRVQRAKWSSADKQWSIEATQAGATEPLRFTTNFLWMCQGYYRHAEGYTPEWPGKDEFQGNIIHPMTWPEGFDYAGKNLVVVGSGATAATIVPALAEKAGHITLLQRSPSYYRAELNLSKLTEELRELDVDDSWIHEIARRRFLRDQENFAQRAMDEPERAAADLIAAAKRYLGPGVDMVKHFTPRHRPWQQRVALLPGADLFKAIAAGKVSVVTDEIDRFDATGIRLKSGEHLAADAIITATGFHLTALSDIAFSVDGRPVDFADTITYRGMMFTGVPNMVWVFGYLRVSWTFRAELVADFVCRLLNHMTAHGFETVQVALRPEDEGMALGPWIDPDNFNAGYMKRGLHLLPRRGDKSAWAHTQDYRTDRTEFPAIDLSDSVFRYG